MDLRDNDNDFVVELVYEAFHAVATTGLPALSLDWEIADLGYDSVQILEALAHIEEAVGVVLPQQSLVAVRAIGDLADAVRSSLTASSDDLVGSAKG